MVNIKINQGRTTEDVNIKFGKKGYGGSHGYNYIADNYIEPNPKQIIEEQTKKKIIIDYIQAGKMLTQQLDEVYKMVMGTKKPTAEELVEELNLTPPRIK